MLRILARERTKAFGSGPEVHWICRNSCTFFVEAPRKYLATRACRKRPRWRWSCDCSAVCPRRRSLVPSS